MICHPFRVKKKEKFRSKSEHVAWTQNHRVIGWVTGSWFIFIAYHLRNFQMAQELLSMRLICVYIFLCATWDSQLIDDRNASKWAFLSQFQSELDTLQATFLLIQTWSWKIWYTRKVMSDLRQKRALLLKSENVANWPVPIEKVHARRTFKISTTVALQFQPFHLHSLFNFWIRKLCNHHESERARARA